MRQSEFIPYPEMVYNIVLLP